MKLVSSVVVLSALLYSCNAKKEEKAVAVSYEMKTFRLESKGGCSTDSLTCAYFEVNYPVFSGLPQAALDSLSIEIAKSVSTGNPEIDSISFQKDGEAFISEFEDFVAESSESTMGWSFDAKIDISIIGDSLISLVATNESFAGGAHGSYETYFINVDPNTGKHIVLSDLLKPGYEGVLLKAGEEAFRNTLELPDSVTYSDEGYEFPNDVFQLNSNYGFTNEGIRFVFNAYEVAPYVLGAQDFVIPYDRIKDWIK
ncbi:MAG TPA: DUF3298 domain-containing protein [Chryseolinea sp.]|nr:DUF3298 domain-containing protein [Chryseolinea sp.]